MQTILLISIFGVMGVLCRYGIDTIFGTWNDQFPTSTILINLLGSFAAGTIYALASQKDLSPIFQTGLLVGFCGGFTTFSAYTLQTMIMLERGRIIPALTYLAISPALGLIAASIPIYLLRK